MGGYQVVADEAGYVIRDNGTQIAWCADGGTADAIADALDEAGLKEELEEVKARLDDEETRSVNLERAGGALALEVECLLPKLRGRVKAVDLEQLEVAVRAWRKVSP